MSTDQQVLDAYRRRIEAAAIAGLILQPQAIDHVRDWLQPDDFTVPHYGDWYSHLLNMRDREEPIDQMTLLTALRRAEQLGPQGQYADELATIAMAAPVPASTVQYCRSVIEESVRDRIAAAGIRLTQLAHTDQGESRGLVARAADLVQRDLEPIRRRHQASQRGLVR